MLLSSSGDVWFSRKSPAKFVDAEVTVELVNVEDGVVVVVLLAVEVYSLV